MSQLINERNQKELMKNIELVGGLRQFSFYVCFWSLFYVFLSLLLLLSLSNLCCVVICLAGIEEEI